MSSHFGSKCTRPTKISIDLEKCPSALNSGWLKSLVSHWILAICRQWIHTNIVVGMVATTIFCSFTTCGGAMVKIFMRSLESFLKSDICVSPPVWHSVGFLKLPLHAKRRQGPSVTKFSPDSASQNNNYINAESLPRHFPLRTGLKALAEWKYQHVFGIVCAHLNRRYITKFMFVGNRNCWITFSLRFRLYDNSRV